MTTRNDISITTPAGRTIRFTRAAIDNINESGLLDTIDQDVDGIVNGGTLAALLDTCQTGADVDRLDGWADYCDAILHTADNELLAAQAAGIHD